MFKFCDSTATYNAQRTKGYTQPWEEKCFGLQGADNIPEAASQLLCDFRAVVQTLPRHQGDKLCLRGHVHINAAFTIGSLAPKMTPFSSLFSFLC